MPYRVTKTYGHDLGLSACFRQPQATSHCRFLHGYALSFKFTFEADDLDVNNWVIDFGGLKPLKAWLCDTFDHKLLVAEDDPERARLEALANLGSVTVGGVVYKASTPESRKHQIADVLVVRAIGCEAFAAMAAQRAMGMLAEWQEREVAPLRPGVRLVEVEVREHGANSAIWMESK